MNSPRRYPPEVLERISQLAEAEPQCEVCGLVVTRSGTALEVFPVANLAAGRSGFLMDPLRLLQVLKEVAVVNGEVAAVYHSHVEAGAYLSSEDREAAVVEGIQQLPGAEYLVVSVRSGSVRELRRYLWDGQNFTESPL